MRKSEKDSPKPPQSFLYKVLRAVVIGLIIYYVLGFLYMCAHINTKEIGQYLAALQHNRQANEEPFVAWNGKAPTLELELQRKVGYEWADVNNVRKHALCRERWVGKQLYEKGGCSQYVTKVNVLDVIQKLPPIKEHVSFDDGTTTAECVAERKTRWDLILNDMYESGDGYAASVDARRRAAPDIRNCDNFDNNRVYDVVQHPQLRLTEILRRVRNGGVLSNEDRLTIQKDYPGVESFPPAHSDYRQNYLSEAEELFKISGGKEYVLGKAQVAKIPDLEILNKSIVPCEDYVTKINSFKAIEAEIAAKEVKVERSSREWQDLNQARVANMNAWGIVVGDTKASSCINE